MIKEGAEFIVTRGSDAGKKVKIKKVIDGTFVIIQGEKVKERRANIKHLEAEKR